MSINWRDYLTLCKPKVVLLMLLTAWVGMYLATKDSFSLKILILASLGIAFLSGAAATVNHIIDRRVDAIMDRTKHRPIPCNKVSLRAAWIFTFVQAILGFFLLYFFVNKLTALLTLLAALGYSTVYTIYLKPLTSQNIVIGGLSGAMPPLLGWTAVSNQIDPEAWLLVLIIFTWTPAHFWALCLHRIDEYKKSIYPMLPITHGIPYTKLNILFYSWLTVCASLLPYVFSLSGNVYLVGAVVLNTGLISYAIKLKKTTEDGSIALKTFNYSLVYLTVLFLLLLLDHHLMVH